METADQIPTPLPTPTTTDAGIPVHSDAHSMTVGPDGPIVLHDHYLVEQIAQFNRERVPERQPHAKGSGAFCRFEVTHDVSAFTKAAVLQPGTHTEGVIRFSTVAGERGSPDTWRDPRGWALKLYTAEGNYDIVGNNTPVFFIRDPMKFQHFIRSQKRRADSNLRDHDMQWDFWTLSPESAHQVAWLMGDRGIPRTWRHMNLYGSHTYMWVNADGDRFWVKYHFISEQGVENLTQADADRLVSKDTDYHARDLFAAVARGDHPSWTLKMQIMPFADADTYRFNPFDVTKVWPHADYPLTEVGRLTVNRNPTDHHSQIEQAAFEPNNMVPGIAPSPDRMLLGRMFAYADAHRHRIGANYNQLPVNAPRSPVHSYSKDGPMRYRTVEDPVYAPNSTGGAHADGLGDASHWHANGELLRGPHSLRTDDDDWRQAGTLVRDVMDDHERDRLVDNVVGHLQAGVSHAVLERAIDYWRRIDPTTGDRIQDRLQVGQTRQEADT